MPQIRAERGNFFTGRFEQRPRLGSLGAPSESGIALSGVSAKVKPLNRPESGRKCVETSGDVIREHFHSASNSCTLDLGPMPLGNIQAVYERRGLRSSAAQLRGRKSAE
jgi:hypothetical protein